MKRICVGVKPFYRALR